MAQVEPRVGLGDPGQLLGLLVGEVVEVLPQRCRTAPRASFHALRRTSSSAWVAHRTTWNGSAHCTVFGHRSVTTAATHGAASAETWMIAAHRSIAETTSPSRTGRGCRCRGTTPRSSCPGYPAGSPLHHAAPGLRDEVQRPAERGRGDALAAVVTVDEEAGEPVVGHQVLLLLVLRPVIDARQLLRSAVLAPPHRHVAVEDQGGVRHAVFDQPVLQVTVVFRALLLPLREVRVEVGAPAPVPHTVVLLGQRRECLPRRGCQRLDLEVTRVGPRPRRPMSWAK